MPLNSYFLGSGKKFELILKKNAYICTVIYESK